MNPHHGRGIFGKLVNQSLIQQSVSPKHPQGLHARIRQTGASLGFKWGGCCEATFRLGDPGDTELSFEFIRGKLPDRQVGISKVFEQFSLAQF